MRTWILLDVNYLCWRNYHGRGWPSRDLAAAGLVYGLHRDLVTLESRFGSDGFVFCFDGDRSLRAEAYPAYKANRIVADPVIAKTRAGVRRAIKNLRDTLLPDHAGAANVFWADGYEADDVAAVVVDRLADSDNAVLVSEDSDFLQLLRPNVTVYAPRARTLTTYESFVQRYNIKPEQWALVKAYAGDPGDNLRNAPGVGVAKAIDYLNGNLPRSSKAYKSAAMWDGPHGGVHMNLELIKLPYPGIRTVGGFAARFRPGTQTPNLTDRLEVLLRELDPENVFGAAGRGWRRGAGV